MATELRCDNENCVNWRHGGLNGYCAANVVVVTKTAECETFWLTVAAGRSNDLRKIESTKSYQMLRYDK